MEKTDIKTLTRTALNTLLLAHGFKECHSRAIFQAVYRLGMVDFLNLSAIPKTLRTFLYERFWVSRLETQARQISADGTEKFSIQLGIPGEETIECVYIPEDHRETLCVSSQVGCKFACAFCVSGRGGFVRHLKAAEMVNQVMLVNALRQPGNISNVVFMGTGEPLDNYDEVIRAIHILRDAFGLGLAKRKISLSTCGLVPGINRLSADQLGIRLSVSLHSADNEKRSRLMPINKKYPLELLRESIQAFSEGEGLPVFLEYILIHQVNTGIEDARALAAFVKGLHCKINLIPYNWSPYYAWLPPSEEEINAFRGILEGEGVFYWLRKSRGQDIAAACGLLKESQQTATL